MKYQQLKQSIAEARRFLDRAVKLKLEWENTTSADERACDFGNPYGANPAAVKRASMDLSKSLAQLRKG